MSVRISPICERMKLPFFHNLANISQSVSTCNCETLFGLASRILSLHARASIIRASKPWGYHWARTPSNPSAKFYSTAPNDPCPSCRLKVAFTFLCIQILASSSTHITDCRQLNMALMQHLFCREKFMKNSSPENPDLWWHIELLNPFLRISWFQWRIQLEKWPRANLCYKILVNQWRYKPTNSLSCFGNIIIWLILKFSAYIFHIKIR